MGIYRGLSASLARQSLFSSNRHGLFGVITATCFNEPQENLSLQKQSVAGAAAGAVSSIISNPTDVVLIRMQADGHWPVGLRRNYKHVFHGLRCVVAEEGFASLWRGCGPTITRAVTITATQLPAYHTCKRKLISSGLNPDSISTHIMSSIVAATVEFGDQSHRCCENSYDEYEEEWGFSCVYE